MDRATLRTCLIMAGAIAIVMTWITAGAILSMQEYRLNIQAEELLHVPVIRNQWGHCKQQCSG